MNIEEIMKPYFDKKEEFSKRPDVNEQYKLENDTYEKEMLALKARLQTLRSNRNSEIEEYVRNAVAERPDFYAGYGAMIRKDLEQEYLKREKALELQIIGLSDKINNNYLKMAENNKYTVTTNGVKLSKESIHRVDVRELVDLKHDARKALIALKKELELKLQEAQLQFNIVMHKLTVFKHEYNENHVVINGKEYRNLFEESNRLIEVKYNLQRQLEKLEENLKLTELTEEEIKVIMMSMTDSEKKEYEERKKVDSIISTVEQLASEETETKEQENKNQSNIESTDDLEEQNTESVIYESEKEEIEEQNRIEENYSEFIKEISKDVLRSVKKLRGVKVTDGKYLSVSSPEKETEDYELEEETAEIANGLYFNKRDVFKALNNYVRKNKGQSFTVKGITETLTVNRRSLKRVKEFLKECTIKKLFSEKKLSAFDIKRVFGKNKAEKYTKDVEVTDKKVKMPTGDYILRTDIHEALKLLFVEKTPTWLETLKSKFVRKNDEITKDETLEAEYEVVKTK